MPYRKIPYKTMVKALEEYVIWSVIINFNYPMN